MTYDNMEFGFYDKAEQKAHNAYELYEDGQISQALSELQEAIEIDPLNSSWYFNKALALDAINKFDDAIIEYENALQLNPMDLEILNSLAVDYTRIGHYDLALNLFEHIEQIDPAFEPSYCNRIITYTEMEKHDLAEQMFYMGQQINPDCALCYYNIGNNLFVRGKYRKAIHCWLKTSELDPTHPQINYRIAQAHWADGNKDLAREHFLGELRNNPGDIDVILDFGLFLLELGDIDSAREKFNRILEFIPEFASAYFYLGEIAMNNDDLEKAVQLYDQALQNDNSLPGPRYRLAQIALRKNDIDLTKANLAAEMKLELNAPNALVSMASMFLIINEIDQAVNCLIKAIELDCTNADAHYYLGLISAEEENYREASEFFTHALEINPDHLLALRDSACIYLKTNRTTDAAERITKARKLAPEDKQIKALDQKIKMSQTTKNILSHLHLK